MDNMPSRIPDTICGIRKHGAGGDGSARGSAFRIPYSVLALLLTGCMGKSLKPDPTLDATVREASAAVQSRASRIAPPAPAGKPASRGEVRLSLQDSLRAAMLGNHDIQLAGYTPRIAQEDIVRAEAVFDPTAFFANTFGRTKRPIQSVLDTGAVGDTSYIEDSWAFQGGLRQPLIIGGVVSVYEQMNWLATNSDLTIPNPQFTGSLNVEVSQPLLRGFGARVNRATIRVADVSARISRETFRTKVMDVAADVTRNYWQLAHDLDVVRVSRQSLDQAREVLRREGVRLAQGLSKEVDVDRARAAVAIREVEVVRSENQVRSTLDRLKLVLNSPDLPLGEEARVVQTAALHYYEVPVDRSEAVAKALARRPDLEAARLAVAGNRLRLDVAEHETLPRLDAVLRGSLPGLGTSWGDSFGQQWFSGKYTWSAGVEFEMPVGNRTAKADERKRRLEYEQSLMEAEQLVAQAVFEVNEAVRGVLVAHDEVDATTRAQDAAERAMKGELARFELGETTNHDLLIAQDNLATAQRDHLRALLAFNTAVTDLARAQGMILEEAGIEIVEPEPAPPGRLEPVRARVRPR